MEKEIFLTPMNLDLFSYCGKELVEDLFIFFHGFPGLFTRNEDLAAAVSAIFKADVVIPQYRGIGRSGGEFLFSSSIEDSVRLIDGSGYSKKYKRINIIGHSWGGFVALSALSLIKSPISKVVLLSPFTTVPEYRVIMPVLEQFVFQQKCLGKIANLESIQADLTLTEKKYFPDLLGGLKKIHHKNLLVVQAKLDTVIPSSVNEKIFFNSGFSDRYVELSDNHWFTSRQELFPLVFNFLNNKQ